MPDKPLPWWHDWNKVREAAAWALNAFQVVVWTIVVLSRGGDIPPPAPPKDDDPVIFTQGWIDDPDAVAQVVAGMPIKSFLDTPAGRSETEPEQVFLWDAARKATGDVLPARNQGSVGSCVAFGCVCAVEYLQCVQIANGQPSEFKALAQEVVYGGSRVEIGGGRIRGDGSVGGWAARWCSEYGVVARGRHGEHNLERYDESLCRQYGAKGVPADLEPIAKQRPVKNTAPIRSAAECRKALASGYPVSVASSQGFVMKRDSEGFCKASGTWMHQMAILGYQNGSRPGFWIQNSWGPSAHTGPKGAGSPPEGGFWAEASVVDRMLRQGDSWAFSDVVGFPKRKLTWYDVTQRRETRQRGLLLPFAMAQ